jgi:FkbM family methyltransferase
MAPIVNTRRLFAGLLRTLDIATICDVGSMDGTDALLFRRSRPRANVLAFEPNPENFTRMQNDGRLHARGIRLFPFAASDRQAEAPFFVVATRHGRGTERERRGMSSLHRRADPALLAGIVPVRTVRLDQLLAEQRLLDGALALWIDAEGMALEVIRGADGVLANTRMLHVEVETTPCIAAGQHLFPDVHRCLEQAGFRLLATDHPLEYPQFNALFVRAELMHTHAASIGARLALARLRRCVGRVLYRHRRR